jgi:hypothetical protein
MVMQLKLLLFLAETGIRQSRYFPSEIKKLFLEVEASPLIKMLFISCDPLLLLIDTAIKTS